VAREILDSSFYMTLGTADADGRHWVLDPGASPDQRTPVTP
jgi:hypothetical protein